MYNLKKINGKLKGDVGEIIYTNLNRYAHRAEFGSNQWLDKMPFTISDGFKLFLRTYWGTIDVFELVIEDNIVTNIIFYEIKTSIYKQKRQCLTQNSCTFYEKCLRDGFLVKSILVYFAHNWNFEIIEKPFNKRNYSIWNGGEAEWKK